MSPQDMRLIRTVLISRRHSTRMRRNTTTVTISITGGK